MSGYALKLHVTCDATRAIDRPAKAASEATAIGDWHVVKRGAFSRIEPPRTIEPSEPRLRPHRRRRTVEQSNPSSRREREL